MTTTYCQHAYRLRLVRPGHGETLSERPRDRVSELFTDGTAGTQVTLYGDEQGCDVDFLVHKVGALVALPCPDHPDAPKAGPKAKADAGDSSG